MAKRDLGAWLLFGVVIACGPGKAETDTSGDSCLVGESCSEEGALCGSCDAGEVRVCKDGVWVATEGVPEGCGGSTGTSTTGTATTETTEPTGGSGGGSTGGGVVPCGMTLPPEGSACAMQGEDCAPDADPCNPYTGARCEGGVWQYYEVGPGDPMTCGGGCEPFPMDGQPCTMEGASCSTGCEDQCQFCNLVSCEGGVWKALEVFPADCLDCPEICPFTVMAMCANGPPDEAACVAGCMDGMAACKIEFSDMLACAGSMPTFMCNADERPTIAGCETRFDALYACLGL